MLREPVERQATAEALGVQAAKDGGDRGRLKLGARSGDIADLDLSFYPRRVVLDALDAVQQLHRASGCGESARLPGVMVREATDVEEGFNAVAAAGDFLDKVQELHEVFGYNDICLFVMSQPLAPLLEPLDDPGEGRNSLAPRSLALTFLPKKLCE